MYQIALMSVRFNAVAAIALPGSNKAKTMNELAPTGQANCWDIPLV